MSAYWSIMSARMRMLLQYRAAAVAGMGTQLFWGLIRMMIFEAFYRSTRAPQPMSLGDTITYVWLGQAMLFLLPWSVDQEVRTMIRTGTVAYELARPLDLYSVWFMRCTANRLAPVFLRSIPILLVAWIFFGFTPPASAAAFAGWLLTTFGALLLGSAVAELMLISLLWTVSGEGIWRFVPTLAYAFSGMLVPIPLWPAWGRSILAILPFSGLVDSPFRVYLGLIPPSEVWMVLAHQLTWTVVLVALGRWAMSRGMRHLVVQGG